ncbi:ATP-binding cassette domain-containing protein [Variovorax sp. J22R133]|uniref:ABC transporter ATP-binding protein n=1 Tax=Variovorax brevis TaxID=3053503 RepID=UPI0025768898|nr:ATP-binding cassette domain-containing protein [Variovorax sp. J22R133]MDM0113408.1 ATP-binding cassette domain-containing protein [Variovorax sp. J22R133]
MNTSTRPDILRLHELRFAYPGEPPLNFGPTLAIGNGITQVYGDTGSGKSTLLKLIAGELTGSGQLTLSGVRLDANREAYRRQLFFVEAPTDAFDQLTGRECTTQLRDGDEAFDEGLWQAAVEGFALPPHIDKKMFMLSTGTKRKVWLAAALASGRPLVLLDEPTGGLDAASIRCLWRLLSDRVPSAGRAVVVASSERIDDRVPLAKVIELPLA